MGRTKRTVTWGSLTAELNVTHGAPRRLLTAASTFLRDVQDDYRESVGPIFVPGGGATPGTIGGVGRLNVARRYVPRSDPRAATTASDDVVIRLSM